MLFHKIIPIVTILIFLSGISISTSQQEKKVRVSVTMDVLRSILFPLVEGVGEVKSIVPEEAEPHSFTLTPSVVKDVLNSDLIVVTGHMEWETDLVKQVAEEKGVEPELISLNLLNLPGIEIRDFQGERNIHGFWLLPDNTILIARALETKLSSLKPEYSQEFKKNRILFEEKVSSLKAFLSNLSDRYRVSGGKVVIGFYAEQYVAEAMGLKASFLLIGEEETVSPGRLSEVLKGLKSGDYLCVIVSDVALMMSNVQNMLQEISMETGSQIAYVSVVSTSGLDYYDAVMYYNAGQVYGALLSGRTAVSTGSNQYLMIILFFALTVIIVETILLVRGRVRV